MSNSIEQKRRELFEEKYPTPYYIMWNVDRSGYYSIHRDSTRKRGAENYDAKWLGFNAGLDAVVIELPGRNEKGSGSPDSEMGASLEQYEAVAYNFALDDCRDAIK